MEIYTRDLGEILKNLDDVTDVDSYTGSIKFQYRGVRMILLLRYMTNNNHGIVISPYRWDFIQIISLYECKNEGELISLIENSLIELIADIKDRLLERWIEGGQKEL